MTAAYDAIVTGAGISGMYQLHRLRGLGVRARVFEAGDGVGGTWYWNRYPGARFDSESWTYGYSFSAISGVEVFRGEAYHTGRWPHEPVSFVGKRVGIIGTGATAVQAITESAKTVGHLTVFQRTPNWCAPLHNSPIDATSQARIKATYPEIFARCRQSFGCFIHDADPRKALEVSAGEREALFEKLYREPGFGIWMGNFRDVLVNEEANATLTEFMRRKIRERV